MKDDGDGDSNEDYFSVRSRVDVLFESYVHAFVIRMYSISLDVVFL